jgi:hypothetical protein
VSRCREIDLPLGQAEQQVLFQRLTEEARDLGGECAVRWDEEGRGIVDDDPVPSDLPCLFGQQPE